MNSILSHLVVDTEADTTVDTGTGLGDAWGRLSTSGRVVVVGTGAALAVGGGLLGYWLYKRSAEKKVDDIMAKAAQGFAAEAGAVAAKVAEKAAAPVAEKAAA